MSLHIHRFVDLIRAAESRQQSNIHMSMQSAKDLHADITKLLLNLQQLQEKLIDNNQPIVVQVQGGDFKNT